MDRANHALELSEEFNHPSSLALSYEHLAGLHRFRREPQAAYERAQDLVDIAGEMGSDYDAATGKALRGWALVELGEGKKGLDQIRHGLSVRRPLGPGIEDAHMTTMLAEALGKVGESEEALLLLEELLLIVEETGQHFWEAEIHRLKRVLLVQQGFSLDEAEKAYQHALAISRRQGTKSLELQALMDLERLYQARGISGVDKGQLSVVVDSFAEGFDTLDFVEARALSGKRD